MVIVKRKIVIVQGITHYCEPDHSVFIGVIFAEEASGSMEGATRTTYKSGVVLLDQTYYSTYTASPLFWLL